MHISCLCIDADLLLTFINRCCLVLPWCVCLDHFQGVLLVSKVKKVFGITEAPHYVLSPFRPELQLLTINVKNFLTSAAAKTQQNILQSYVVENVRRAHVQSIILGSGIIVIGSTEAACEAFIEQYSNVCNPSQIALLLGTRKMSISKIQQILSYFKSG